MKLQATEPPVDTKKNRLPSSQYFKDLVVHKW